MISVTGNHLKCLADSMSLLVLRQLWFLRPSFFSYLISSIQCTKEERLRKEIRTHGIQLLWSGQHLCIHRTVTGPQKFRKFTVGHTIMVKTEGIIFLKQKRLVPVKVSIKGFKLLIANLILN